MGMFKDIFKGVVKKQPPASTHKLEEQPSQGPSLSKPSLPEANEEAKNPYGDPFDPFTPRATDNLPPEPNIQAPPPLPRREQAPEPSQPASTQPSNPTNELGELEGSRGEEHLDPLLPPQARSGMLSSPDSQEVKKEERMEEYGIVQDNTEDRAAHDKIEEIINDLRFLRAQNDMILEMLKKIERRLP